MDFMEGLLTRRSVRQYDTSKKISKETIREIIKAAQYSPTAHNKQPWEFLVIEDKEFLANLRHIQRWTSFAKDASCVVIVCGDIDKKFTGKLGKILIARQKLPRNKYLKKKPLFRGFF